MPTGIFQLVPTEIFNYGDNDVGVGDDWECYFSVGGPLETWNNANVCEAINTCETVNPIKFIVPSFSGGGYIRLQPGPNFLLDGVLTDRLLLGLGFTMTSFTWTLVARISAGFNTGTAQFVQGQIDDRKSAIFSSDVNANNCTGSNNYHATHVFTEQLQLNTISLLHDPFGLIIIDNNGGNGFNSFIVTGTYFRWSSTLTKTPDIGGPGTEVTITDASGQLLQAEEILFYPDTGEGYGDPVRIPINSYYVTEWTSTSLIFTVPIDLGIPWNTTLAIVIVINGFSFSGEVPMGILSPTLIDGSGIYTLSKGKRNDTFYDRSTTPVETIDRKIPDPLIKTGFFNAD